MTGSRLSAPVSRATRTPRVASTCQSSSSQRSCARRHASHSQRRSAPPPSGSSNARSACESGATRRRVALGEPRHERVEEHVGRRPGRRPARRARGLGHLALIRAGAEAPGEHRRRDRLEVGLAGHRGVEGLEPPGRLEQQRRRVAPAPAGEHDLRAQPLQPRALELVERPELGGGRESSDAAAASATSSFACAASSARSTRTRGVGRQLGRALQERGGRRQPAAALRAVGRARHLRRHRLVGRRGRVRAMPRAPVGIELRVGRLGERPVHVAAVAAGRAARYTAERTSGCEKRTRSTELDQPGGLGRPPGVARRSRAARRRATAGSTSPSGSAAAVSSSSCVSRGSAWTRCEEGLLDAARQRSRVGEPEPAGELGRRQPARQLEQRERVAARLGEDPVAHALVHAARARRTSSNERASSAASPSTRSSGKPASSSARRRTRAPRTPSRRARPAGGGRRTRAPAPTRDRATARRRRGTRAAAPRPLRPAGSGPPARRGSDPAAVRAAGRTPCSAHRAAGAGSCSSRSSMRRAQRVQPGERAAPSRPARRRPGRSGTRRGCRHVPSSAVLPTPASPRSTSTRLWPARTPATSRSSTSRSLTRSSNPDEGR